MSQENKIAAFMRMKELEEEKRIKTYKEINLFNLSSNKGEFREKSHICTGKCLSQIEKVTLLVPTS